MEIMELAAQLGQKIKEDDRIKRYNEANEAYNADEALQKIISEYNAQRAALEEENKKETPDTSFVEAIEGRLQDIYQEIIDNETFIDFKEAEADVNDLMHMVNSEITFQITGERPCDHSHCDSCEGCH